MLVIIRDIKKERKKGDNVLLKYSTSELICQLMLYLRGMFN